MPGKKLKEKFAKVIFAKQKFFKNRESFFQVWKTENKKGNSLETEEKLLDDPIFLQSAWWIY